MSDKRPFTRAKGEGGQGVQRQRDPEQRGPFATGKLSSPFPYYGGKSRWIDTVWQRLGKVGVFAEPCCGTAVMMLNNPEPAPREVICDLNAYICNFYRALRADPDAVAYWADWPTNHHDLTARHRWLLAQGPELSERMTADPDDYDCKIAGWWVWGQSSWIGHGWCDIEQPRGDTRPQVKSCARYAYRPRRFCTARANSARRGQAPADRAARWRERRAATAGPRAAPRKDQRPMIEPTTGGRGVQQQRDNVPGDQRPFANHRGQGQGVQQQRDQVPGERMPRMSNKTGGRGVQQQNLEHGVQQQRDQIPWDQVPNMTRGQGVSMQRAAVPRDRMPFPQVVGGRGVQIQRERLPRDGMPRMPTKSDGQGVAAQRRTGPGAEPRDQMPVVSIGGGSGVSMQKTVMDGSRQPRKDDQPEALNGSRLRPWFRAIAQRLARCIILNRSWESALTDSVLQQTPSSPKPSVGVFLDPPYRTQRKDGGKRSTGLYQGDNEATSDAVARATYEWAVNGRNKLGERYADKYRIAYCMHADDFPIPPGWTFEVMGFSGHRDQEKKKELDCVMFSPACVPVPTDPQGEFDW